MHYLYTVYIYCKLDGQELLGCSLLKRKQKGRKTIFHDRLPPI